MVKRGGGGGGGGLGGGGGGGGGSKSLVHTEGAQRWRRRKRGVWYESAHKESR